MSLPRRGRRQSGARGRQAFINFLDRTTFVRLKPSPISGVGVFAVRDIPRDTNPFQTKIPLQTRTIDITAQEMKQLAPGVQKIITDFLHPDNASQRIPIPTNGMNSLDMSFYLNHSETPNTVAVEEGSTAFMEFRTLCRVSVVKS